MGEFFKEHLETIMMVSFIAATALGMYKTYVMFEDKNGKGIDPKMIEDELITLLKKVLKGNDIDKKELFEQMQRHESFDEERYFNFNENKLNRLLDRLFSEEKVESFEELKKKL